MTSTTELTRTWSHPGAEAQTQGSPAQKPGWSSRHQAQLNVTADPAESYFQFLTPSCVFSAIKPCWLAKRGPSLLLNPEELQSSDFFLPFLNAFQIFSSLCFLAISSAYVNHFKDTRLSFFFTVCWPNTYTFCHCSGQKPGWEHWWEPSHASLLEVSTFREAGY